MIITRTPLRISFFGGGSDLPAFYQNHGPGYCLSTTIDKYIYLVGIPTPQPWIKLTYSKVEQVEDASLLQHDIAREMLLNYNMLTNYEIGSFADIPTKGTGLGSSSTFAVCLSKLLSEYKNIKLSKFDIAEEACHIEIDVLKNRIGKQDQYAASFGGFNLFRFEDGVQVEPINIPYSISNQLNDSLVLMYTGITRSANDILNKQSDSLSDQAKVDATKQIADMALYGKKLINSSRLNDFGSLLNDGWELKRSMVDGIANEAIDQMYEDGLRFGAIGGKLLGAGGGGYILFYVPPSARGRFLFNMNRTELQFKFEHNGTSLVHRS